MKDIVQVTALVMYSGERLTRLPVDPPVSLAGNVFK